MSDLKQAIKQNYIKCAKEPSYFINQYCTIQHPQRGKIKFKLYPFQYDVLNEYQNNDYNVKRNERGTLCIPFFLPIIFLKTRRTSLLSPLPYTSSRQTAVLDQSDFIWQRKIWYNEINVIYLRYSNQ